MEAIRLTRDLRRQGFTSTEIARLVRGQELSRVRRGAYVEGGSVPDARDRHRRLIEATVRQGRGEAVLSHGSAAVLHGLPVWADQLVRVELTRDRSGGGRRRSYTLVHGRPLDSDEVVSVSGLTVTSLARTVLDLACGLPLGRAVAVGDAALRAGLDPGALAAVLDRAGPRRGLPAARRAIALLDAASESPGESESRVMLLGHGVPRPTLQFTVTGRAGEFVGRTDFGWPELRTVGEFDGRVKYGRALRPGQDLAEVLYAEKQREDAIRDLDWQMVRWITPDIHAPGPVLERLERAFVRGRR